jgi:hypothetical protein
MPAYCVPDFINLPLASPGLVSFRYRGAYGWIMIGARDVADALNEASRSINPAKPCLERLQVWDGSEYIPIVSEH